MKWKNSHLGAKNNAAVHTRNLPCQDKNLINLKNTVDKSSYQASQENIQNKVLVQKNELRNIKDRFLPTQMKWHVSLKHSNIIKRTVFDSIIPSKVINDLFSSNRNLSHVLLGWAWIRQPLHNCRTELSTGLAWLPHPIIYKKWAWISP